MVRTKLAIVLLSALVTPAFGAIRTNDSQIPDNKDFKAELSVGDLEGIIGAKWSPETKEKLAEILSEVEPTDANIQVADNSGKFDILFRENHHIEALVCGGASLGLIVKGQVAVCTNILGDLYYLHGLGLIGAGPNKAFGAAGEAFVFLINKRKNDPVETQFTQFAVGGEFLKPFMSFLSKFPSLVSPKAGAFHSIQGNQGGLIVGIQFGKYIEFGITQLIVNNNFSQFLEDLYQGNGSIDGDERSQRLRERRIK